jgi:beta-phosphoglucomutase-like phosphatase (HAD superfamily)
VPDERSGGVVFDGDGTLLDTNDLHVAAWWEAFATQVYDDPAALLGDLQASPIGRLGRG